MEFFKHTHQSLLESPVNSIERDLQKRIDWGKRLICIKGFRGIGKTTFILDYIKKNFQDDQSVLYINLNNFYFTNRRIFSFADEFSKLGGKILFLDQIQKYPDWASDLKKCYEKLPDLQIIFTSSPVLRVIEGNPELKGIVSIYHLEGLSLREYINYRTGEKFQPVLFDNLLENHQEIAEKIISKIKPLAYFGDYLKSGYFPYFIDRPNFYHLDLLKQINLALEIDVPYLNQIELKYLSKLRKLLHIIARQTPFTPNISKLAAAIETSRATVMNYLRYLKNARLINLLYNNGGEDELKKPELVLMNNTNLLYAISPRNTNIDNLRLTFFYNQVNYQNSIKSMGDTDLLINEKYHFSVGNENSQAKQNTYTAADMIEIGEGKKIPLWLFGFLY